MNRLHALTLCALGIFMSNAIAQTTDDDARIDSVATADTDTTGMNRDGIIPSDPDPDDPDPLDPLDPILIPAGDKFSDPIVTDTFSSSFSYSDTINTLGFWNRYAGRYTKDVFYRFTLTVPMNVTITHEGSVLSDTYMTLLRSDSTVITANNDYSGIDHCSNTHHAFIRRQLSAGTYYIVTEGYSTNGVITTNITGNTDSGFNYPTIPSTYSTNPGKSVGGMGGQFAVSPMGGATYSIPIEVPQGVGGLQPQLSIVYNSQSGNGLCGYGASLAGISAITRGPKDIYHDGTAQGMKYLADDALYLDGVRLILSSGTAGQNGAVYHPESDPFTTVTVHNNYNVSNNTMYFEVQSSDGMTYHYGDNANSRLTYTAANGDQRIHSWYIRRVQQPTGNYITYSYLDPSNNNYCVYPYRITYGNNASHSNPLSNVIEFVYQDRSDVVPIRFDGKQGGMARRLKTITCKSGTTTYRKYTLNYDITGDGTAFKFSRLTSVTEQNGQNESLPATQFNWSFLPTVNYNAHSIVVQSSSTSFDDEKYSSADLNGDGISDIIGSSRLNSSDSSSIVVNRYVSDVQTDGSILFAPTSRVVFTPSVTSGNGFSNSYLNMINEKDFSEKISFDFDGDGLDEYVIPCRYRDIDVFNNMGYDEMMGFFMLGADGGIQRVAVVQLETSCTPLYAVADFDNDGRTDIIVMETEPMDGYALFLYRMHIISSVPSLSNPYMTVVEKNMLLRGDPRRMVCTDVNGNGLTDLVILYDNSYSVVWNQGGGMSISMFNVTLSQSDEYNCYGTDLKNDVTVSYGDFNGDGFLDVITRNVNSRNLYFHLNNGDGTMTTSLAYTLPNHFSGEHLEVIDINADGKSDVIMTGLQFNQYSSNQVLTCWLCSDGSSLSLVDYASSVNMDDIAYSRYITGDFDGNGRTELVNYGYDCVNGVNSNSAPVWRIYKNSYLTTQSGKVTSVTGDFGTTTSITYSTLADNSVYTRGTTESYPAPRYTIPLNVVKQTVQDNGASGNLTTKYTYEGLKAHLSGRGLLGFCKTTSNCTSTGVKTESGILQWDTIHYIPKVTYSLNTIGGDTSRTTITLTIEDKGQRKYFAYPSQTITTDMDGVITTTYRSYNKEKGYITSDSTVYASNMYRSVSYRDYTPNKVGGAYRPQTVVQSQFHSDPNNTPFSRTTKYTYNSNGTVYTKVENYGSSMPLTTNYGYDQYGNITSQESTGSNITPCTTYYQYDATHRFPVRIYTNPASSVKKYTYDLWGHVLTERDSINNSMDLIDSLKYDNWGFLIRTRHADGSENTWTRGWNNDAAQRWYVLERGTARPWVKTWYDNRGREVRTESVGPMNVSVTSTITYNERGQISYRAISKGNLNDWVRYEYDTHGELFRETRPGDSYIMYGHWGQSDGTRNEQVNDNGRTTTYVYDAWGNLKLVTDPVSSVTNTYASNGRIKQTTSEGAIWTFIYDDCGNRTMMIDSDADTTWYAYDALGREIGRTDARHIVFVTNYDYLGRVTQRSAGSSTINYTYGTSGNGQMSLISESDGTWTKSYTYDNLGRVTGETMSKGNTFSMSRDYNYGSNGLLSSADMPGGKTCTYAYDAYGNLTGLDFNSGTITWSLTDYTGRRTTSQTVLNGGTSYPFVKTVLLDQYGYLDSLVTIQTGCSYQEEKYIFDPIRGNLTQMNNRIYDYPLHYDYDNADRLTTVRENNQDIMSVTYSANGNITSKTGIGQYTYGVSSKPHAVMMVENSGGLIDMNTQELGFNGWNRLTSVWQTDDHNFYSYSIDYGPDLKRVTSEMHKTYQKQYEKFYWDDYEEKYVGNDTLRYWYIFTPGGLEGLYIEKSTPNGMTSHTTKVITDHLGSIESLIDNGDWVYDVSYDAWGKREVLLPYWFDPTFDRGYCGHEHIDELGLINMNGRMYDPLLGRFLSPDNYIQSPTNPQNFNRYSYCLNNPLKYTDPDGEFVFALVGAILFTTGMTNVFIQASNDNINSFGDAVNAFIGGVSAGISEGTTLAFGFAELSTGSPLGVLLGHCINFSKSLNMTTTLVNSVLHPVKAAQIFLGRYYTDENGNAWDQAKQGLSRFMWEGPQTWAGYNWSQIRSIGDRVDEVDYLGGATFCINENGSGGSVSLGNYINADISTSYQGTITKHPVLMHEYGHTFDSRKYGPAYLFEIGIPSAISAKNTIVINKRQTHRWYWTELRANQAAKDYFGRYYGVDWSQYENFVESNHYYPTDKPLPQFLRDDYLEWYYQNLIIK